MVKERLLRVVLVNIQVAISRKVSRFKLQIRDRHEARGSRCVCDETHKPTLWVRGQGAAKDLRVEGRGACHEKEVARKAI